MVDKGLSGCCQLDGKTTNRLGIFDTDHNSIISAEKDSNSQSLSPSEWKVVVSICKIIILHSCSVFKQTIVLSPIGEFSPPNLLADHFAMKAVA